MLGAIIGDIIGSPYEWKALKTKDFPLFSQKSSLTDDSYMTIAVGCACADGERSDEESFKEKVVFYMRKLGREFFYAGYGGRFRHWLRSDTSGPYNSFGNGSAMRVSPVAWYAQSLEEAERLAAWSAEVTHNHPEGIKGAVSVAAAIFMARSGKSKEEIKAYVEEHFYSLDFTIDDIRPDYTFNVTCRGSVPQSIKCFLEAEDYEDTVRLAVSLGGDADTQAAIAGSIAEAYYGIPEELKKRAMKLMSPAEKEYFNSYAARFYS